MTRVSYHNPQLRFGVIKASTQSATGSTPLGGVVWVGGRPVGSSAEAKTRHAANADHWDAIYFGSGADRATELVAGVACWAPGRVRCSSCGQMVEVGAPSEDCCPARYDAPAPRWVREFRKRHGVWPVDYRHNVTP